MDVIGCSRTSRAALAPFKRPQINQRRAAAAGEEAVTTTDDRGHRLKRTWAAGTYVDWKNSPRPTTTSRSTEDFDIGA
jgi:hypothetical protein